MNKIIYCFEEADSTEECVEIINNNYKVSNWKRINKFKLPAEYEEKVQVRVFSDGSEELTVVLAEECTYLCTNLNLTILRPIIDQVNKHAKNFYTWDYGQIYLNPYTLELWVSCGDGGIFYSTLHYTQIVGNIENYQDCEFPKKNFEDFIPEIKSTTYEAEYSPEYDGSDGDWIPIGKIKDICNY